uniref:Uncharacterized protein n=1 Tax=Arion vulgaris TaxID=1028688 RepID=A0A0B7C240_9EUPU
MFCQNGENFIYCEHIDSARLRSLDILIMTETGKKGGNVSTTVYTATRMRSSD